MGLGCSGDLLGGHEMKIKVLMPGKGQMVRFHVKVKLVRQSFFVDEIAQVLQLDRQVHVVDHHLFRNVQHNR